MFYQRIVFCMGGAIVSLLGSCASFQTFTVRKERKQVLEMVHTGGDIMLAQDLLTEKGYKFIHPKPIFTTQDRSYLQQIVKLPSSRTTGDDIFFYVMTGGVNPFRFESGSVVINAQADGVITKVE